MNIPQSIVAPALLAALLASSRTISAAPRALKLSQSAEIVEAYDFVEATIQVAGADAANPFTDVTITGAFGETGAKMSVVNAECCPDSQPDETDYC